MSSPFNIDRILTLTAGTWTDGNYTAWGYDPRNSIGTLVPDTISGYTILTLYTIYGPASLPTYITFLFIAGVYNSDPALFSSMTTNRIQLNFADAIKVGNHPWGLELEWDGVIMFPAIGTYPVIIL
jgi:hypothetical protein